MQGWVTALSFLSPSSVIALLAGIGKNQAHLAPVSSSQIEGSLSTSDKFGENLVWAAHLYYCCKYTALSKRNRILFPRQSAVLFVFILRKSPYEVNKREIVEVKRNVEAKQSVWLICTCMTCSWLWPWMGSRSQKDFYFFILLLRGLELFQNDFCFFFHQVPSFLKACRREKRETKEERKWEKAFCLLLSPSFDLLVTR